MQFVPVGHVNGVVSYPVDLTVQLPWLYVIVAVKHRVLYIGETNDRGGLIVRLGSHFGYYETSTLKKAAARVAGIGSLRPPFVVVAARLPTDDPAASFDASSKKVRLLCEALMHESVAHFASRRNWTLVSINQPPQLAPHPDVIGACNSIFSCIVNAIDFLSEIAVQSPFHLVILNQPVHGGKDGDEDVEIGALLNEIEVMLYEWLLEGLKKEYGDEWWAKGVPMSSRRQCATRVEEEGQGGKVPPEGYLTLIDLRDILQKNWLLFGSAIEGLSREQGKDRGTRWLVELNEMRKRWAHPIKQRFLPIPQDKQVYLQDLLNV